MYTIKFHANALKRIHQHQNFFFLKSLLKRTCIVVTDVTTPLESGLLNTLES